MGPATIPPESSSAAPKAQMPPPEAPYLLQCLEVFGGSQLVQHALGVNAIPS